MDNRNSFYPLYKHTFVLTSVTGSNLAKFDTSAEMFQRKKAKEKSTQSVHSVLVTLLEA